MHLLKNSLIAIMIALIFIISYYKEVYFEMINTLLVGKTNNYANIYPPQFLLDASLANLLAYKWVIFGITVMLINVINYSFLVIIKNQLLKKAFIIYTISLTVFIFLFYMMFLLFGVSFFEELSRIGMQVIQSPMVIMLLILLNIIYIKIYK